MHDRQRENEKTDGKFVSVLKKIFVHNIGWKLLSLVSAAVVWFLAAGLL